MKRKMAAASSDPAKPYKKTRLAKPSSGNSKKKRTIKRISKRKMSKAMRRWRVEKAILKAVLDFKVSTGVEPYLNMGVFSRYFDKFLGINYPKMKVKPTLLHKYGLMEKIGRLRNKYRRAVKGVGPVHKSFDLCKKIWGPDKDQDEAEIGVSGFGDILVFFPRFT